MITTVLTALLSAALAGGIAAMFAYRNGKRTGEIAARAAVEALAEARESGLRQQLEDSKLELVLLRPKAEEVAALKTKLEAEQERYTQMKADLDSAFKGAAADALRANTESFLAMAKQELGGQTRAADSNLEAREKAIENLVKPVTAALEKLDQQTHQMETARADAYGEIRTLVETIGRTIPDSVNSLRTETAQLITALRAPKTRGNWGELQLKRAVEYTGMVQYCSFSPQVSTRTGEDATLRPDMTIQLPNGRTIVVDAKTPLDAFLDAGNTTDPNLQSAKFLAHAERVRTHLKELSAKAYWRQFESTPDFVVCFLPSEALFSSALEADPSLLEYGSQANVILATPTTLIALLKAVAYGWQQSKITESAKAIQQAGLDLYSKLVTAREHLDKIGSGLASAVGSYNRFVGSVEGKGGAFYQARKLGALVTTEAEIAALDPVPAEPRELVSDDWAGGPRGLLSGPEN